ncbi:uncharacterized protein BKA78DRAFT_348075 [Phyllosticta capitalensis]|uniref:uncharacterized protein n=1 Tax=Phyllosticta capitalensis TaxID=121624 RepID=UPI0031303181
MAAARKQSGDCDDTYPVRLGRWQIYADKEGAVNKANADAALCWKAVCRSCSNRYRGAQTSPQQHVKILTNSFHSYTHKPTTPQQVLNLFDSLPKKSRAASPRSTWAQPLKLGRKRLCLARYSAKRLPRHGMSRPPFFQAAASPSKPAKDATSRSESFARSPGPSATLPEVFRWTLAPIHLQSTFQRPAGPIARLTISICFGGYAPAKREPTGYPEVKCLVCNDLGHRAQERVDPHACRNFKQRGHNSRRWLPHDCHEQDGLPSGRSLQRGEGWWIHDGRRSRDCTQERVDPHACRNCKQCGHKSRDCPEPHSVADEGTKRNLGAEHESPSKKLIVLCLKETVSKKVELEAELNKLRSNVAEQRAKFEAIRSASDSHPLAYSNHIDVKADPPSPEVPTRSASDATGAYLLFWVPRRVSFAHIGQRLMPTSSEEGCLSFQRPLPLSCRHSSYARSLTRRFIHLFPCPTPLLVQILERACPEAHLFVCNEAPVLYTPPPTRDEANGQETKSFEDLKAGPKTQSSVSAPDPVAAVLQQIFQNGPTAAPPADTERADSANSASKLVAERQGGLCFSIPPSESDSESTTLAPRRGGRNADDAANALPLCLLSFLDCGEQFRPFQEGGGGGAKERGRPRRRTRRGQGQGGKQDGAGKSPTYGSSTRRVASSLATMMRLCPQGRNDAEGRDQLGAFGDLSDQFCRRQIYDGVLRQEDRHSHPQAAKGEVNYATEVATPSTANTETKRKRVLGDIGFHTEAGFKKREG